MAIGNDEGETEDGGAGEENGEEAEEGDESADEDDENDENEDEEGEEGDAESEEDDDDEDGDEESEVGDDDESEDDDGDEDQEEAAEDGDEEDEVETHELSVTVENSEGEPVADAPITVESKDMGIIEGFLDDPDQEEADEDGTVTFELGDAEYSVETVVDDEEAEERVEIDGDDEQVTLSLDTDAEDAAEAEDEDETEEDDDSDEEQEGEEDEGEEGEEGEQEEEVDDDEESERNELIVVVENENGEYIQGATVSLENKDDDSLGGGEQQDTGSDGETRFLVEDGDYVVEAESDEGSAEDQFSLEGDDEVTLTVVSDEETHSLTVTVQDEEGDPVSGASITVESEDMGVIEGFRNSPTEAETDASGQSSFDLVEGQYTVTVEADNEKNDQAVEIEDGDEEATLTLDVAEDEEEEEEGRVGPKEAEGEVDEDESASHGTERGSTVLYLDLEGLFLDLLGLEVDLHEVVLDIRAITGEGNLLGNLLSAVAGLLDSLSGVLNRLLNTIESKRSGLKNSIDKIASGRALNRAGERLTRSSVAGKTVTLPAGGRILDAVVRVGDSDRLDELRGRVRWRGSRVEILEASARLNREPLPELALVVEGFPNLFAGDPEARALRSGAEPLTGLATLWASMRPKPDADSPGIGTRIEIIYNRTDRAIREITGGT
ncbi:MAG: carboxypeptidase regulatory-like domain-containing protein, partial [Euryarchaeota archaeon]|nr:carboxypeptidase regulatory-like domain-containing protein [Euryarchaeota archaeon]